MFTNMDQWIEIRRRVLNGELSKRAACVEYGIHWDTLTKILTHSEPPGYRMTKPRASKLEPFLPVIHEILENDRKVHRKQRHTAQRIFDRLRDEHDYTGGVTIVKEAVREWKESHREVFLPLSHPPGEAQVDYGFADVVLNGETVKVALFVMTLPSQTFEAHRIVQAHVDSLSLVRFDRNSYSVPTKYAHRQVTVVGTVDEVRLIFEDRLIARHERDWGKEQFHYEPLHYLALLERKPGGFDHAKPFEEWDLPVCFGILRRRLEAEQDGHGTREFIRILRLLEQHTLPTLKQAVQHALEIGATNADALRLIVEHQQEEPVAVFCLDGRPHLKLVRIQKTDVAAYQSLIIGG